MDKKKLKSNLIAAAKGGNLAFVKSALRKGAEINSSNSSALIQAARYGHLDVVSYLLTSSELKEKAKIYELNYAAFRLACENGHLHIIKYFLETPNLDEPSKMHLYIQGGFSSAIEKGHLDVVEYLASSNSLVVKAKFFTEGTRVRQPLIEAYKYAHKTEKNKKILEFLCINTTHPENYAEIITSFNEPYQSLCSTLLKNGKLYYNLKDNILFPSTALKNTHKI